MSDLTITAPDTAPAEPPAEPEVLTVRRALRDAIADLQRIPVSPYSSAHVILNCRTIEEFFTRLAAMEPFGEITRTIDSVNATARLTVGTVTVTLMVDSRRFPTRVEAVEVPAWPEASQP